MLYITSHKFAVMTAFMLSLLADKKLSFIKFYNSDYYTALPVMRKVTANCFLKLASLAH